jgi:pyruvate,water dikinase
VVTTAACERILATVDDAVEDLASTELPGDVWAGIVSGLRRLGGGAVAVRSSGTAEDLPDASYAGRYETVLGVSGPDEVARAVRRCLASAGSARVRAYSGSRRYTMAVLIQRLVPADAAGVAFTANPVTGDEEILVSAVRGVGDRLVSGEATPDEWVMCPLNDARFSCGLGDDVMVSQYAACSGSAPVPGPAGSPTPPAA